MDSKKSSYLLVLIFNEITIYLCAKFIVCILFGSINFLVLKKMRFYTVM